MTHARADFFHALASALALACFVSGLFMMLIAAA